MKKESKLNKLVLGSAVAVAVSALLGIDRIWSGKFTIEPINEAIAGRRGLAVTNTELGYGVVSWGDEGVLDKRFSLHRPDGSTLLLLAIKYTDGMHRPPSVPSPDLRIVLIEDN